MKTVKMRTEKGEWIITDRGVKKRFTKRHDALLYLFMVKEIREHTTHIPKCLYPVYTLDPRLALMKKKLVNVNG